MVKEGTREESKNTILSVAKPLWVGDKAISAKKKKKVNLSDKVPQKCTLARVLLLEKI